MASPKRAPEPLTEEGKEEMMALLERAHNYDQLSLRSPPANKKMKYAASPTPATTAKKAKRQRDALGDRAHERRYAPMSQQAQYFTKVQRAAPTAKSTELASQKASAAAMALWNDHETRVQAAAKLIPVDHRHIDLSLPVLVAAESVPTTAEERATNLKGPGLSTARRNAVHYFYAVVLGSPPPVDENGADLWGGVGGVNAEIRAQLWIPEGSSAIVTSVLKDCWEAHQTGEKYDADGRLRMRGRKASIQEMSDEAYIIYRAKRIGMSLGDCTVLVSEFMRSNGRADGVSYGAVQRFIAGSSVAELKKRCTKKSGKDDLASAWCVARLAQVVQWRAQFALGEKVPIGGPYTGDFPPLYPYAIAWWDEHHRKIRLGHASKWECRLRFDKDGNLAREEDGGELEEAHDTTTTKFPGEARGVFGCVLRRGADGELEGSPCAPYCYSGKLVLSPEAFQKKMDAELRRVEGMSWPWTAKKTKGGQWLGYKGRWPDTWEVELRAAVKKGGFVCVTELMDHVIDESERVYKGTVAEGKFSIFHDCLLQWWTPKAQEFMKARGYEHRQLRILPPTCAKVNTRYRWKLVGDSPELCRGLDSHGFADLDAAVTLNCSLATYYPKGHAMREKWNLGNVDALWNCMAETWMKCAPTSDRIAEDIMKIVPVLDKIIEAKGGVVPDEFYRTGRRWRRVDDKGDCTRKPGVRQRKGTLAAKPYHPDLAAAYKALVNPATARTGLKKAGV